eukprot:6214560-Pleurochrysis_carterae.AAC.5
MEGATPWSIATSMLTMNWPPSLYMRASRTSPPRLETASVRLGGVVVRVLVVGRLQRHGALQHAALVAGVVLGDAWVGLERLGAAAHVRKDAGPQQRRRRHPRDPAVHRHEREVDDHRWHLYKVGQCERTLAVVLQILSR